MRDYSLPAKELEDMHAAHRCTRGKREASRIKVVVLLATGWTAKEVAEILPVDPNMVRDHFDRYR